jgi:hypothetical protein
MDRGSRRAPPAEREPPSGIASSASASQLNLRRRVAIVEQGYVGRV